MLLIEGAVQLVDISAGFMAIRFIKWCVEVSMKIMNFYVCFLTPISFYVFCGSVVSFVHT